jgi:hypothetical protein
LDISYTKNYKEDKWQNKRTGFIWALSFLGAELSKGSFDKSIKWINSNTFRVNLNTVGFNDQAIRALEIISDSIKKSDEYQKKGSLDIGAFIALTLGSSWHYYEITGVPKTLSAFKTKYDFSRAETFPLTHSSVAKHNRILRLNFSQDVLKQAYMAEEGEGDFLKGEFKTSAYETFDIMPNGQLRFAVYDKEGNLMVSSPQQYSQAGKPAKCLWCHEIVIQPLFIKTDTLNGFISPEQFQKRVTDQMRLLNRYRSTLKSDVDFVRTQDHTFTELLYISYMEPSLERLSQEWNMPAQSLKQILSANTIHQHEEFKQFGDLYHRKDILGNGPYKNIPVPGNIREESTSEPNFFKTEK